jgi:hypothetical protein
MSDYDRERRAREKQAARDADARRLASGEVTPEQLARENGTFAFPDVVIDYDGADALVGGEPASGQLCGAWPPGVRRERQQEARRWLRHWWGQSNKAERAWFAEHVATTAKGDERR